MLRTAPNFFLFAFLILPLYGPASAQLNTASDDPIQLVMPKEGCFNIDKKVPIKCIIKKAFDPKKLVVLLNGEDLSGIDIKADGFEYTGTNLITPGSHILSVAISTLDGQELQKEFGLSVCPSKIVDETNPRQGPKSSAAASDSKGEGNLINESRPGKKDPESTSKATSRPLGQNMLAISTGNRSNVTALFDRNPNTLGTFNLFSDKLQLKALYTRADRWGAPSETSTPTGTPSLSSLGSSGFGVDRRGDMLGTVLTSELWGKELVAEAEINLSGSSGDVPGLHPFSPNLFSPFSPGFNNALNSFPFRRDNTYRLKLRGESGNYNYEASYEYLSFDDRSLGTQGIADAMQRYMFKAGGKFFQVHSLNLSLSQYTDNIKGNNLSPKLTTTQAAIDYSFTKFESLPITLSYQRSMARAKNEPSGYPGTKINMDMMTANINYLKGPWNLGLQVSYSLLNDMSGAKNDNTTLTVAFLPIYNLNRISIAPGFSFGSSQSHGVNTNTYIFSLDLRGDLFSKKLTYGVGGAYTRLTTSDNSSRQDTLSVNANLFYSLSGKHWGFSNPSIGITGLYGTTNDRILRQARNGYEFLCMFQAKF